MLTNQQILKIALTARNKFRINCEVKILPYSRFLPIAEKSPLIQLVLDEGVTFDELSIPAIIWHEEKEHIYLCGEIIKKLLKGERLEDQRGFIKAIMYHELFHIVNEKKVKRLSISQCFRSEERVCKEFYQEYPKLAELGAKIQEKDI